MTKTAIRAELQQIARRISVCEGNGHCETVYPAQWAGYQCGERTTTSESGNTIRAVIARRANEVLGCDIEPDTMGRMVAEIHRQLAKS